MFLILLKITQLCLTKCPQGYGLGERSRATHDCPLVQYYMDIPPFWPYPPIHPVYIFRKQIKPTYLLLIFHAIVNSHFLALVILYVYSLFFSVIFLLFPMFHKFI